MKDIERAALQAKEKFLEVWVKDRRIIVNHDMHVTATNALLRLDTL
jgi:hypothetical protein